MNSTLKPVLPASSQNPSSATSNKPMHPQGAPVSYGQPSGQITQNPFPNTNMAHNHPTTQQNHFPHNVPGGASHFSMGTIPASNHPVAINQTSGAQGFNTQKNAAFTSGFQHGVGLAASQNNTIPPVSQALPATTTPASTNSQSAPSTQNLANSNSKETFVENDLPQPNGTPEVEPPTTDKMEKVEKPEVQGNHVTPPKPPVTAPQVAPISDNKAALPASSSQSPEKPSIVTAPQEKKPIQEPKVVQDLKPAPETTKVPSEPVSAAVKSIEAQVPKALPSAPVSVPERAPIPEPEPVTAPILSTEPVEPEPIQNDAESSKTVPESDPLAIDAPGIIADEKPTKDQQKEITVIAVTETKEEDSDDDDKSSEEQSSEEEYDSEKGQEEEESTTKTVRKAKTVKPEPKTLLQKSPGTGKTKRQRIRTQHYQSPLPEIEIITKISTSRPRNRNIDDKLIYFYKNEFLAVRNAEGGFYLCQAVQNIYKSSSKIKIRWLSQDKNDKNGEIYTPDFYDLTDFDCILTSLDLTRVGKGRYKLKPKEKERTDSILKRCLAVEKGEISQPSLSEEHPDGLDLSLYKDEEQLLKKKKKRGVKRKGRPRSQSPKKETPTKKSPVVAKARRVESRTRTSSPAKKTPIVRKAPEPEPKVILTTSRAASSRGKRKAEEKTSPVVDHKKAKVLAKIGRKAAVAASSSKPQSSKSVKVTKQTPSTSKVTKPAVASRPPPRKAKRTGRK